MFLLEINEFNAELMQTAARQLNAKNLQRLLNLTKTTTTTTDKEERFGLDPWVQWVSIHTGKPSTEHGIGHLGDVPDLRNPQIWETLDQMGVSTAVWGAMNARRGNAKNCAFFLPDPWTFSERAHPEHLNDLLALPRYYSQNYGAISTTKLITQALRLLRFCLRPAIAKTLIISAHRIIGPFLRLGLHDYLLFAVFDLVNAILFSHYWKRYRPGFSILFMNSLAHLQHHKWTDEKGLSKEMVAAFTIFDQAIGVLFSTLKEEPTWLVTNAFTQRCSYSDNEYLYRQRNPTEFLRSCGVNFLKVEQAMTNDGHIFFASIEETDLAESILRVARIDGQPAFHVERNTNDRQRLFFQFIIWSPIPDGTQLEINGRKLDFYHQFEKITRRTGSHVPIGDIFSAHIDIPESMPNHHVHDQVINFFKRRLNSA